MARYGYLKPPFKEIDPNQLILMEYPSLQLKNLKDFVKNNFEFNIAIPHNIIGPNQKYMTHLEM